MADQTFTAGQVLTAEQLTTLQSNSGLTPMTPSSVSGTNVTLVGNTTTIAAGTTASINGVFTSSYTNYLVVYNLTVASTFMRMQLKTAGADISTNYGLTMAYITDNSTAWAWLNAGAVSWNATNWLISNGVSGVYGQIMVFNPNLAANTWMDGSATAFTSTNSSKLTFGGRNAGTDQATGLTFFPSSGTFTGTVNVYGYRK
jgi:hypothetical protein